MAAQIDTAVEARVKRLSRYYALLSAIDREIIHPGTRDDLFARVCRIAVDVGAIYRFLTKPWEDELLRNQIHQAFRVARGLARL